MTPEEPELLATTRDDGVLLLRLNRPRQRNALATPLLENIAAALRDAEGDCAVRCVVVTGNERVFAAGADIDELARSNGSEPVSGPRWLAWSTIEKFTKPIVAAVEGWCLGAGSELMLRADIVVASRSARIGQPETNLGIIPGAGGTAILPRKVGLATAMDMVLTGEPISGERAYQLGLVSRSCEDGAALDEALELARRIAARAPNALRTAKASVRMTTDRTLQDHLHSERELFLQTLASAEKTEGTAAFREKRPAIWAAS